MIRGIGAAALYGETRVADSDAEAVCSASDVPLLFEPHALNTATKDCRNNHFYEKMALHRHSNYYLSIYY